VSTTDSPDFVTLQNDRVCVAVDVRHGSPELVHVGAPIGDGDVATLGLVSQAAVPLANMNDLAPATLLPQASLGFPARPGLEGHRLDGGGWAPRMTITDRSITATSVAVTAQDESAGVSQRVELSLDPSGVIAVDVSVTNIGSADYQLVGATITVPLPTSAREVMQLGGRWSNEFRQERKVFDTGAIEVENRAGRTSHDRYPAMFLGESGFSEQSGEVLAAHLAWSGNARLRAEVLTDGRRILQAGELLLPGEMMLAPGETYVSPRLLLAWSNAGLNGISDCFHPYVRSWPGHPTTDRPVLLNTWEAVYFDHDLDTLKSLADAAAEVGAERFVLDDGWFRHRRDDTAGLGDWYIDEGVWPNGLNPIIDHVRGLGLEFGLWFEPEMVNPDSDLYRAHPEWALVPSGQTPVEARNQLVLDVANPDVFAYLLERINSILGSHDIGYVKWDMNRNLVAPTHDGRATVHAQTRAVYELIDQVKAANPGVEIESCSSGTATTRLIGIAFSAASPTCCHRNSWVPTSAHPPRIRRVARTRSASGQGPRSSATSESSGTCSPHPPRIGFSWPRSSSSTSSIDRCCIQAGLCASITATRRSRRSPLLLPIRSKRWCRSLSLQRRTRLAPASSRFLGCWPSMRTRLS